MAYNEHMIHTEVCEEAAVWDEIVHDLGGHPLQLWGWGEVKSAHNWRAHRVIFTDDEQAVVGAAQVLERTLPTPFRRLLYVPRGPVWKEGRGEAVIDSLASFVKTQFPGVVLTVEPDSVEMPLAEGWRQSPNTILIPSTLILDLTKTEDELLAAMTKKTRQYIRKSGREGVEIRRVRRADDIASLLAIYRETAARAGFALHDDQYYYDIHEQLGDSSIIFAAYVSGAPVAFLWLAASRRTAFELYGGMNDEGRDARVNYTLKWHAIRKCQEWGIERYDLNGLLNDGISTFKRGFADHEDTLAGTYDYPLSPLYTVWTRILPFAKRVLRALKPRR